MKRVNKGTKISPKNTFEISTLTGTHITSASLSYVGRKPPSPARGPCSECAKDMEVVRKKQEVLNLGHRGGKAIQDAACTCVS